jgi:S-adenosylmethionine/arginine decarboxylase-like enzyme
MAQHLHLLINANSETGWRVTSDDDILDVILLEDDLAGWLNSLVSDIGMKAVFPARAKYVYAPGNEGITASINIETSHIALHIWDAEHPSRVQFDLYTCGDLDPKYVLELLDQQFEFSSGTWLLLDREDGFVVKASGQFPL